MFVKNRQQKNARANSSERITQADQILDMAVRILYDSFVGNRADQNEREKNVTNGLRNKTRANFIRETRKTVHIKNSKNLSR